MSKIVSVYLFFGWLLQVAIAISAPPRSFQQCAYLQDSIYCYGGRNETLYQTDLISLYVHNDSVSSLSDLSSSWNQVSSFNDVDPYGRARAQVIALPHANRMYIHGGLSDPHAAIDNPFIVYDALNKTWSSLPDYTQYNLGQSTIVSATVTYSPVIDRLIFYGGYMPYSGNRTLIVDGTRVPPYEGYLNFGFHNLTTFDIETQVWEQRNNTIQQDVSSFTYASGSIYVNNMILFIGGVSSPRNTPSEEQYVGFSRISAMSLLNNRWVTLACSGTIPPPRVYFTTTLLPDNRTVLLYGGDYAYVRDSGCYLLDTRSNIWRRCEIDNVGDNEYSRMGHSAVLVNDHLFILFGLDSDYEVVHEMVVLDVSDPQNIRRVDRYGYLRTDDVDVTSAVSTESSGMSGGAIAGIVIGCIVGVAVLIGAVMLVRRKKAEKLDSTVNGVYGSSSDYDDYLRSPIAIEHTAIPTAKATNSLDLHPTANSPA